MPHARALAPGEDQFQRFRLVAVHRHFGRQLEVVLQCRLTAVNAGGGWLHKIAGEAYVVVPDGFEAFATPEGAEAKTVKNRVARLGRHRERSSPTGAANTFRAELEDGRRTEGMVLDGELLWDDEMPPEAAGKLGRRRR